MTRRVVTWSNPNSPDPLLIWQHMLRKVVTCSVLISPKLLLMWQRQFSVKGTFFLGNRHYGTTPELPQLSRQDGTNEQSE